jgi:hypothetical protein
MSLELVKHTSSLLSPYFFSCLLNGEFCLLRTIVVTYLAQVLVPSYVCRGFILPSGNL